MFYMQSLFVFLTNLTHKLFAAARSGNSQEITELLPQGDIVNYADHLGTTALMMAAQNGHTNSLVVLLENGANLNQIDNIGWSALTYASSKGHVDCVKTLLTHGANPDQTSKHGGTPISVAYGKHKDEIIALIKDAMMLADLVRDLTITYSKQHLLTEDGKKDLHQQCFRYFFGKIATIKNCYSNEHRRQALINILCQQLSSNQAIVNSTTFDALFMQEDHKWLLLKYIGETNLKVSEVTQTIGYYMLALPPTNSPALKPK